EDGFPSNFAGYTSFGPAWNHSAVGHHGASNDDRGFQVITEAKPTRPAGGRRSCQEQQRKEPKLPRFRQMGHDRLHFRAPEELPHATQSLLRQEDTFIHFGSGLFLLVK